MRRHPSLAIALVVGVVSISTAALFVRQAAQEAAPSLIAAGRMAGATILLAGSTFIFPRRHSVQVPRGCRRPIVWAGLFLGAHFYFWITSLSHTSVLSSVVIVTTNPIFVGLASYLFLKEPLHRSLVIGIVLAAFGGAMIALADAAGRPGSLYGNFLSLCGAIMESCYLLIGRRVRRQVDNLSYILPVYAVAALLLVVVASPHIADVVRLRPATFAYIALLAIIPQLIGHSCLNWALGYASATIVAVCIVGEPLGASVLAWAVLKEQIGLWQAVGAGFILAGIFFSTRECGAAKPEPTM